LYGIHFSIPQLAIGGDLNDENGSDSGHVRVYKRDETQSLGWIQLGNDIDGTAAGDQLGKSVSLSDDGKILAIGSAGTTSAGYVSVYEFDGASWTKLGQNIVRANPNNVGGSTGPLDTSLSSNGKTVAIGDSYYNGDGIYRGQARVYNYNGSSWVQLGGDFDGENNDEFLGTSVSLSSDGTIVAIGAVDNGQRLWTGHVRVYKRDETQSLGWIQLGNDIDGDLACDYLSQGNFALTLSSDGRTVAAGAPYGDGNGSSSGYVRVYQLNDNDSDWVKIGGDIDGEAAGDRSGFSVSLSADGKTIATSGLGFSGYVRVYGYNGSGWVQLGENIDGEAANDLSGYSVSMSDDGKTVAIGAIFNDDNGEDSGHVRVYQATSAPTSVSQYTQALRKVFALSNSHLLFTTFIF